MTKKETRELAELIVMRLKQGWDSEAMRLWEIALQKGADFDYLEAKIHDYRYNS